MRITGVSRDELHHVLDRKDVEYIEARIEDGESTRIQYRGKDLEDIGSTSSAGGNIRALYKGGWGFVSFNRLDNLREKADLAVRQARLVGKEDSTFSSLPPVDDVVRAELKKDPFAVPLADKVKLMEGYNGIVWSLPKIMTSILGYGESRRTVVFANSEGSYIEQEKIDSSLRLAVIARQDGEVQQAVLSMGSNRDFGLIENMHEQIRDTAQKAIDLLSAPKVKSGEYTVVLDPILAGVFAHEAFGHLSESDFVYENAKLKEIMVLGRRFGGSHLNIVDGAAIPGFRGSYKYDDEGVPATKTYLIKEGILTGRLHSRETAAKMGEKVTGNARALNYHHAPIVRMTNTIIEPGKMSFGDLIADITDGVYAKSWYGGTTSMEMFTFSAGEAYMIHNGKIGDLMRPCVLTGNVFSTLQNIDAVGNDLDMNEGGGCGKGEQSPLPVSNGSPHIRIQHCLVGGK